jgi:predicted acetyltransferase
MGSCLQSIEIIPVQVEQQTVLANLMELYIHDFSEFYPIEIGADGRYGYPRLPLYWSDPDRHPFFVLADTKLAGFAMVHQASAHLSAESVWDMAEFFVLRSYRKLGIGKEAARQVFQRFPGPWQVRVMQSNLPAQRFWSNAIATFAGKAIQSVLFKQGDEDWERFSFESGSVPRSTRD